MKGVRRTSGSRKESAGGNARPYALAAGIAGILFILLALDAVLRGPVALLAQPTNDLVNEWKSDGLPVHAMGRALSYLGDVLVTGPLLLLAVGILLGLRQWQPALVVGAVGALSPLLIGLLHAALTPHNVPVHGLDPQLVPDIPSRPRGPGEHLFPSGHTVHAVVEWGWLAFVAGPRLVASWAGVDQAAHRTRRIGIAVWVAAALLTGAGRILRQAHGLNDVVAGLAAGSALLLATVALIRWRWPAPGDATGPRGPS